MHEHRLSHRERGKVTSYAARRSTTHGILVHMTLRLALIFCLIATHAAAEMVDGNRIIIIDGDTVALPCNAPSPGCAEKIRFLDIDAPETFHPDCDEGLKAGLRAKARLAELLRGKSVWVERGGRRDTYRRTLAALRIGGRDGVNAGLELVREGFALRWKPGREAKEERQRYWCGPR